MTIAFTYMIRSRLYIHVDKSKVVISRNPLIDESDYASFNIPNNSLGKKVWFWIWVKGTIMKIIFSGISAPITNLFSSIHRLVRVNVDDNPFTKKRGLVTNNVWDNNSTCTAFENVKEFEKSQGTII